MVKTADPFTRAHLRDGAGPMFDRSSVRRILPDRIMDTVFMRIGHVCAKQPAQVAFSFSAMIWLSSSRRQLPIQRSAIPFCHGA